MAKEINLRELFGILKKRFWIIALVTVFTTLTGFVFSLIFTPVPLYQSSTRVIVNADNNSMGTLKVLIEDPSLLSKVSSQINNQRSPETLANEISAQIIDTSQVVSITATDANPRLAAEIANTTASVFKSEAATILGFNKIEPLSLAIVNRVPINPTNNNKMIYGFIGGIILSVGIVFFINSIDNTVQTESHLEKMLLVPALGSIPKMTKKNMYHRRKNPFLKKPVIEIPNIAISDVSKREKSTFKQNAAAFKEKEKIQRINH